MNIKSLKQIVLTVICLLGIGSATAWSQSIHVKGTVLDENGAGFIGAGVVQKGTTNGTMTDANGNFEINVPQGAILQFSFISYVPQELPATQNMKVTLVPDTQTIEETVVVTAFRKRALSPPPSPASPPMTSRSSPRQGLTICSRVCPPECSSPKDPDLLTLERRSESEVSEQYTILTRFI